MNKYKNTYCNPISLPDYPIGREGIKRNDILNWRETADPTVLFEDNKWYLYSSCGMVYWTDDFVNWNHVKMEPYDCGYAPTVVKHKNKYYLCSSLSDLYVSNSPLGPFVTLGSFKLPNGDDLTRCYDPMIFSDDNEKLYLYYTTGEPIIYGVELDSTNPTMLLDYPQIQIKYDSSHIWERMGEYNDDGARCSLEGPWIYKKNNTYYLIYCAPATEFSSYCMGAYKSDSPLNNWSYMKTSPFTEKRDGLVRGPGHGCVVEGPNNTLWAFYTTTICYMDPMERRIGFDPIYIDDNGDLRCNNISEVPQWAPGIIDHPEFNNDCGLINISGRRVPLTSSSAPGRDGIYATDESMLTFWQPDYNDLTPTLTLPLAFYGIYCSGCRIIWRDVNLSLSNNALPGPIKYKLELYDLNAEEYVCVYDQSKNKIDKIIDYFTFEETFTNNARLTILDWPKGITPAVINLSLFGQWRKNDK